MVVDGREAAAARDLVAELRGRGLEVEVGRLEAGDYLVEGAECYLVERSTLPDLARKVVEARLWGQLRAMSSAEGVRPLLLVEGGRLRTSMSPQSVAGALLSVALDWGVPVVPSFSRALTAAAIEVLSARAASAGGPSARPIFKPRAESPDEEVLRVVASLPGVGPAGARALLARFRTVQALANASLEEIMEVEGFGERRAARVHRAFRHAWGGT